MRRFNRHSTRNLRLSSVQMATVMAVAAQLPELARNSFLLRLSLNLRLSSRRTPARLGDLRLQRAIDATLREVST